MSRPFLLLVLFAGVLACSQSVLAQSKCTEPIRQVIWKTLNRDILSGPWDCRKVLDTQNISSGELNAILIRGHGAPFCGATGNCSTWLLNRRNAKWRIILDPGSVIKDFEIKSRGSTDYPDLLFRGRIGAGNHYLGLYRSNGLNYKLLNCKYEVYDTNGRRSVSRASRMYCS